MGCQDRVQVPVIYTCIRVNQDDVCRLDDACHEMRTKGSAMEEPGSDSGSGSGSGEGEGGFNGSGMFPSGKDVSSKDWIMLSREVDEVYISVVIVPLTSFLMEGRMSL